VVEIVRILPVGVCVCVWTAAWCVVLLLFPPTYLRDGDDVNLALELRQLTLAFTFAFAFDFIIIDSHDVRLHEMRVVEPAVVLEHLKPQVPEIHNVEAIEALSRSPGLHQMSQVMADEAADIC
jgi:hypothetical protein